MELANWARVGNHNQTTADRCGIGVEGNRWETLLSNSLKVPQATSKLNKVKSPSN
ncbi:hypothetical protein HYY74_00365 [Candidatus Woesearchaeota archaeon]|nr:hypothetical protein [Candidatus Woesearchaeota archaeon]